MVASAGVAGALLAGRAFGSLLRTGDLYLAQPVPWTFEALDDKVELLEEQAKSKRNSELLSTAGSLLGGLLGGRKSRGGLLGGLLGKAGAAAGRRGSTNAAGKRVEAADNKRELLTEDLAELESELETEIAEIDARWMDTAKAIEATRIGLEATDVKVTQIALAWIPVS